MAIGVQSYLVTWLINKWYLLESISKCFILPQSGKEEAVEKVQASAVAGGEHRKPAA